MCLNILREDWKPVLNLNSVMVGLQYLFLEPNADDPLNKGAHHLAIALLTGRSRTAPPPDAAEDLRKNRDQFAYNVKASMRGGVIKGQPYEKVVV